MIRNIYLTLIAILLIFIVVIAYTPFIFSHPSRSNRSLSIGTRIIGGTPGSLLFIDLNNKIAEDNANLFYDDTNDRLGIGTNTPLSILHLSGGTGSLATGLSFGDGDSGFYEVSDDVIGVRLNSIEYWEFSSTIFGGKQIVGSATLVGNTVGATVATFTFNGDTNTGMGRASADELTLITGGSERVRVDDSGNVGIGTGSPTEVLDVNSDAIRIRTPQTPSNASSPGDQGQIEWDSGFIYVCTATDTWKRTAISSWAVANFNLLLDDGVSNILLDDGVSIIIGR